MAAELTLLLAVRAIVGLDRLPGLGDVSTRLPSLTADPGQPLLPRPGAFQIREWQRHWDQAQSRPDLASLPEIGVVPASYRRLWLHLTKEWTLQGRESQKFAAAEIVRASASQIIRSLPVAVTDAERSTVHVIVAPGNYRARRGPRHWLVALPLTDE
jgi:hypothetical protein